MLRKSHFNVRKFIYDAFDKDMGRVVFEREGIWDCTTCSACLNKCPKGVDTVGLVTGLRQLMVEDGRIPPPVRDALKSIAVHKNPWKIGTEKRSEWAEGLDLKYISEGADILYYVGCTGAFNLPVRNLPVATASLFQKLGLDFGILGENEICCGSTAMRIGDAEEFKRVALTNLETFHQLHEEKGVNTIVTSCAGCYRAIKKDYILASEYGKMMDGITVIHTVDYLYDLFKQGKLKFSGELPWKVTFHDPCHTGRHLMKFEIDEDGSKLWKGAYVDVSMEDCLYDVPRELLQAIPGIDFREMERIRDNSYCCGGGGGVMTGYGDWAAKNASKRIEEGLQTGAEHMVSICPFCHYNLNEGSRRLGSDMKLYDLVELLDQVVPEPE